MSPRTTLPSWRQLEVHAAALQKTQLKALFAEDGRRFERYSLDLGHLFLDYSKQLIDGASLAGLLQLARDTALEARREQMFTGQRINQTEQRAVLHTALRNRSRKPLRLNGVNVTALVEDELAILREFVEDLRQGEWRGYSGEPIRTVVNLGVGGSHLGPQMVTEALKHLADQRIDLHYVSNADGAQLYTLLPHLDPETTLFVVSSKTFTTTETLTNARLAKAWLAGYAPDDSALAKHFAAVTGNVEKARAFGIPRDNIFRIWDWVGGRFSLWSAIGLPIALYLGFDRFLELLDGAHGMDEHFRHAPLEANAPVLLGLLAVWNATFLKRPMHALLPYDQALHVLPAYLQQAEMESNGKSINSKGEPIGYPTVAGLWGGLGINGQHAFFQYLHQGNNLASADFIGTIEPTGGPQESHDLLMANLFAQTEALMRGVDYDEVVAELQAQGHPDKDIARLAPHKVHAGNRPSSTLLLERLDAYSLGSLIALYEHKIFVQGVVLDIFSFDQWGVELGKRLANAIHVELLELGNARAHDASTAGLIRYYQDRKRNPRERELPKPATALCA